MKQVFNKIELTKKDCISTKDNEALDKNKQRRKLKQTPFHIPAENLSELPWGIISS